MIHRDVYDLRMRNLAVACLTVAVCVLAWLVWGPK